MSIDHRVAVTRHFTARLIERGHAGVGQWAHRPGLEPSEAARSDAHGHDGPRVDGAGSIRDGRAVEGHHSVVQAHDSDSTPIVELGHRADQCGIANR